MSYKTKIIDGKEVRYWESVEENHPETSIAEAAAKRSAESAAESAASALLSSTEASEAKLAAQQAAASASKSAVSIFERAEALQPGGMGMVEVLPLKYLLENNSDATIHSVVTGGYSREYKFSGVKPEDKDNTIVTIKYPLVYQGAKSVIVSCNKFLGKGIAGAAIEDEYKTLMDDGSKAFLLQAEGQKYKRLFSLVYVQDPGYGVNRTFENLSPESYNAMGLTQDTMAPYCCSPIMIFNNEYYYRDPFTGLENCFLHDVYIQEEQGVQYLIIKFETIGDGSPETLEDKTCYWAHLPASAEDNAKYGTERLAIKIHYNPEDFEAEPAQEETSEEPQGEELNQ